MTTANDLIFAILRSAHFTIQGRVGQDPELKYFQSGTCKVRLSLAVNRLGVKRDDPNAPPPDWFKAEFWGPDAEEVTNVIRKGDLLQVTGRVRTETWTDRNGVARTDVLIRVEDWAQVVNGRPVYRDALAPAEEAEGPVQRPAAVAPAPLAAGGFDAGDGVPF
jgi:single-strand DNA-binding protein